VIGRISGSLELKVVMLFSSKLVPKFEMAQAHYDLSDEFFRLFQDPTQTYSCAYFEREDMTLEEAQIAKIDLSLGKLGLEPGMTLLHIGCGWGACINRALDKYDVNVIGLTLSKNQFAHVQSLLDKNPSKRSKSVQLRGWEEWEGKVDRIVSIGAFEHFNFDRYDEFFDITCKSMPTDGVMLLHTITVLSVKEMIAKGLPLTMRKARFIKFMLDEIFPGCRLLDIAQYSWRNNRRVKLQMGHVASAASASRQNRATNAWSVASCGGSSLIATPHPCRGVMVLTTRSPHCRCSPP
jgi:cyclopropane-fatty-acyl-phospholipid synthase